MQSSIADEDFSMFRHHYIHPEFFIRYRHDDSNHSRKTKSSSLYHLLAHRKFHFKKSTHTFLKRLHRLIRENPCRIKNRACELDLSYLSQPYHSRHKNIHSFIVFCSYNTDNVTRYVYSISDKGKKHMGPYGRAKK